MVILTWLGLQNYVNVFSVFRRFVVKLYGFFYDRYLRQADGQYNANIYDIHLFSILFCRLTGMQENMIPHCLI